MDSVSTMDMYINYSPPNLEAKEKQKFKKKLLEAAEGFEIVGVFSLVNHKGLYQG